MQRRVPVDASSQRRTHASSLSIPMLWSLFEPQSVSSALVPQRFRHQVFATALVYEHWGELFGSDKALLFASLHVIEVPAAAFSTGVQRAHDVFDVLPADEYIPSVIGGEMMRANCTSRMRASLGSVRPVISSLYVLYNPGEAILYVRSTRLLQG